MDVVIQYTQQLKEKHVLNIGAIYSLGHDLNSTGYKFTEKYSNNNVVTQTIDTISNAFALPHTFGLGATYVYDNRLTIGMDYTLQKWEETKFFNEDGKFSNRTKISLGAEYLPNELSNNYLKNIRYRIGAYTTLRMLETHEGLHRDFGGVIGDALRDIVGVQFRNMATVGGSIWGRFGFSDVLTVFLAMDTYVELYKGGIIPLEQFAKMKKDNDILVRLIVKKTPCKVVYTSMRNQRTDFPVIACAVACIGGKYRAVIGARPGKAMILPLQ